MLDQNYMSRFLLFSCQVFCCSLVLVEKRLFIWQSVCTESLSFIKDKLKTLFVPLFVAIILVYGIDKSCSCTETYNC